MEQNTYLSEILSQPEALDQSLASFSSASLGELSRRLQGLQFDRVILTGMGASFYSAYPASIILGGSGIAAIWLDAAELVHYWRPLISRRALLWVISQSGRSAEVLSLLDIARENPPGAMLATVNDLESPLAQAATELLPLATKTETAVSSRTYLNSLALTQVAALVLAGKDPSQGKGELRAAAEILNEYLADWQAHLRAIETAIGIPDQLCLLGRGPSVSSVLAGALFLQEAAKFPAVGMQAAQFRHGPIETARPGMTALVFAGLKETASLNQRLYMDLRDLGATAFWLCAGAALKDSQRRHPGEPQVQSLPLPDLSGIGLPLAEIIPIQLMACHLALARGYQPGRLLQASKVTTTE